MIRVVSILYQMTALAPCVPPILNCDKIPGPIDRRRVNTTPRVSDPTQMIGSIISECSRFADRIGDSNKEIRRVRECGLVSRNPQQSGDPYLFKARIKRHGPTNRVSADINGAGLELNPALSESRVPGQSCEIARG